MNIQTEPYEDFTVLHLQGEFDASHCARFQQEIDGLVTAGVSHVALNLRKLRFINSTALGAILEACKVLKREGGRLVVTRPSRFCRDIMKKIRLDSVVPICDSDEEGHRALFEAEEVEGAASADPPQLNDDEAVLLFAFTDPERVEQFIPEERRLAASSPVHRHRFGSVWCGVGKLTAVEHDGLRFLWGGGKSNMTPFEMGEMLVVGTDLEVKFRLPLLRKGHCRAVVTVTLVEERIDGVKLEVRFKEIDSKARQAVDQYVDDLAFLKRELRPPQACV